MRLGWFKVDEQWLENPKVYGLSPAAKVLYVGGLSYASANMTDGLISASALPLIAAKANVAAKFHAELVGAGLWDVTEGGWEVHDYLDHQASAADRRREREANRERAARARERFRNGVSNGVSNGVTRAVSNGVSHGYREEKSREKKGFTTTKGSREPSPTAAQGASATTEDGPALEPQAVAEGLRGLLGELGKGKK